MASYLRPRRGKKATAEAQNIILKRGEIFFEVPTTGVGTGAGKLKMGDGTSTYSNLPYFMEPGAGGAGVKDLSLAAYNALSEAERNNGTFYSVEVGDDIQLAAKNIPFDNTGTGIEATNVQAAIINIINNNNGGLGEDENGMTVHEKLDMILNGSGVLGSGMKFEVQKQVVSTTEKQFTVDGKIQFVFFSCIDTTLTGCGYYDKSKATDAWYTLDSVRKQIGDESAVSNYMRIVSVEDNTVTLVRKATTSNNTVVVIGYKPNAGNELVNTFGLSENQKFSNGVISDILSNTFQLKRNMLDYHYYFVPGSDIRTITTTQSNMNVFIVIWYEDGTSYTAKANSSNSSTTITATEKIKLALSAIGDPLGNDDREATVTLS